jgi:hypothetical protein
MPIQRLSQINPDRCRVLLSTGLAHHLVFLATTSAQTAVTFAMDIDDSWFCKYRTSAAGDNEGRKWTT